MVTPTTACTCSSTDWHQHPHRWTWVYYYGNLIGWKIPNSSTNYALVLYHLVKYYLNSSFFASVSACLGFDWRLDDLGTRTKADHTVYLVNHSSFHSNPSSGSIVLWVGCSMPSHQSPQTTNDEYSKPSFLAFELAMLSLNSYCFSSWQGMPPYTAGDSIPSY